MIREFIYPDLTLRNSFRVAQKADRLLEFETADDLRTIFERGISGPWYVLSGGNNILFTQDYHGTLLTPVSQGIRIVSETGDRVLVTADAGVEWDDLVEWAVEHELWGVENLSLIPGKAGAAPVQNIGAYGCEAKDTIESVEMFCPETKNILILSKDHCEFGYRDSIFKRMLKGRSIITSIRLQLSRRPMPRLDYGDVARKVEERGGVSLRNIRDAICEIRRTKLPDPAKTGNAGSFFKNPVVSRQEAQRLLALHPDMPHYPAANPEQVKLAAGWLIDRAGLKGYTNGHVGVHARQALVLINLGGATGNEVLAFAREVQQKVKETFGVEIEPEVNVL